MIISHEKLFQFFLESIKWLINIYQYNYFLHDLEYIFFKFCDYDNTFIF